MNKGALRGYTLGVLSLCLLLAAPAVHAPFLAQSAELSEAEAERIARLFYSLTGRDTPEAFLEDDILALQDSGRSAADLEKVVRWMAASVPGADRSTLAGILESHIANALGEAEEVVRPELEDQEILQEVEEEEPSWSPSIVQVQELLAVYYAGTERPVPDPPLPEDVVGMRKLAEEGWTLRGIQTLVAWVPANVEGAEKLSFGQAAQVALQDNAYVGGPRWDGTLEEAPDKVEPLWEEKEPLFAESDPMSYDGGRLRTLTTMGMLPSTLDRGIRGALLPGQEMQSIELGVSGSASSGGDLWVGMLQSTPRFGLSAELLLGQHSPGSLDRDGISWDGGPPIHDPVPHNVVGARAALGFGSAPSWGLSAWGYRGPLAQAGGADLSLRLGQPGAFQMLAQLGFSGSSLPFAQTEIERQRVQLELSPRLILGEDLDLVLRYRFLAGGGGLLDDTDPIVNDLYGDRLQQLSARLERQGENWDLGVGMGWESGTWALDWERRLEEGGVETFNESGTFSELDVSMGLARNIGSGGAITLGARGILQPTLGGEASIGARTLVRQRFWLGGGVRVGTQDNSAHIHVSVPL